MGVRGILFIVIVFACVLKWKKVLDINIIFIIMAILVWVAISYIAIHIKNNEMNTPRPVYYSE